MRSRRSGCVMCRCPPRPTVCGRRFRRRSTVKGAKTMPAMSYHRPASVAEAAKLAASDPEARVLAGGQSVLPSMKLGLLAPSAFIDLTDIGELQGIRLDGNKITIGAMTTHAAVAASRDVQLK